MIRPRGAQQCEAAVAKLQTFLDRELAIHEIEAIHDHLAKCPPCRHLFHFEGEFKRLVRVKLCADPAPAALRATILNKLKERRARL